MFTTFKKKKKSLSFYSFLLTLLMNSLPLFPSFCWSL